MSYLNETMHPDADELFKALVKGPDYYESLNLWRNTQDRSDESMADLYARIVDTFSERGKFIHELRRSTACSMISKCLWQNRQEFPHG